MLPQWRIVVVQSRFGVRKLNLNESEGEWVKERQIQINTITEATKVIKLTNELAYSSKFESTWETQVKLERNSLMGRLIWFIFCTFGVEPLSIFSLFLNLCSFSLNHFSSLWLRVTFSYMEIVILIYHFHCSLFFFPLIHESICDLLLPLNCKSIWWGTIFLKEEEGDGWWMEKKRIY